MASITDQQVKFLKDNLLPKLGEDRGNELSVIDKILAEYAKAFIDEAYKNINEKGNVSKGGMASDLEFRTVKTGNSYEIQIGYPSESAASKYYDFQNKGVNGTEKQVGSPYSFKHIYPSRKMVTEILLWLRQAKNTSRFEDQKDIEDAEQPFSALQKKRKKLSEAVDESKRLKSLAYAISTSIKINGITPTRFFDDAITATFNKDFINVLGKALAADVSLKIIPTNGNNN